MKERTHRKDESGDIARRHSDHKAYDGVHQRDRKTGYIKRSKTSIAKRIRTEVRRGR